MHHDAALAALEARRDRLLELLDVAHARYERSLGLIERGTVLVDELAAARRPGPRIRAGERPGPRVD